MTLIGVAIAGGLIWFAGWIDARDSTGEYWAAMGLIAGAGLVMALSQLLGGWTKWGVPAVSPNVFAFAFLPALVVGGWIVVAAQPTENEARRRVLEWSSDIGIGGIVTDLVTLVGAIAFGLGLVFGLIFDTTGPRRREAVVEREARVAEEPTAAERAHVAHREPAETTLRREPTTVGAGTTTREGGTPTAPQPEPDTRPRRRLFRK
jgi:hypothetical protein